MADLPVGTQLTVPEPRVGTYIRIGEPRDQFQMRRYEDGWAVVGASSRLPWSAVIATYLRWGIYIHQLPAWKEQSDG